MIPYLPKTKSGKGIMLSFIALTDLAIYSISICQVNATGVVIYMKQRRDAG